MNELTNSQMIVTNRKKLSISGVTKVDSFNPSCFSLITCLGKLLIKGNELAIEVCDLDKGEISITGEINSLIYDDEKKEVKKSFIQKLFK